MKKLGKDLGILFCLLLAVVITAGLYYAKTPPFSFLEKEDKEKEAEAAPAAAPAESDEAVKQEPPILIGLEELDHKVKEEKNSWPKTFTIVNPATDPVVIHLFVQGKEACRNDKKTDCVDFPSEITVAGNASETVTLDFNTIAFEKNKPIDAKLLLAGGGLNQEVPFVIEHDPPEAKTFGTWLQEDFSTYSAAILTVLAVILVAFILYVLLYWRILPFLLPERFLPLRMEIGEDADSKKLWMIFSSRVRELQVRDLGKSMVVPQQKSAEIDLPANLGKEGEVVKTVIDLLSWILPRRGLSMRMQSVDFPKQGKGLSVSLVQNQNDEVVAERIFWAATYGLDPEKVDVERLLMTPVVFWTDHSVKNRGKEEYTDDKWQSLACCALAGEVWSSDEDLARKLYVDALFYDRSNRQAKAGLGRIWVEASQDDEITEEKRNNYLGFALAYLKAVYEPAEIKEKAPLEPGKDALWFAAKYNRAVACLYMHNYPKAHSDSEKLLEEVGAILDPRSKKKDVDLINWLKLFKPMATQLMQSALVKKEHPSNIEVLDGMVKEALKQVAASAEIPYDGRQRLLVNLDYRSQYNTACFFSRCYDIAKGLSGEETDGKAIEYAELSLDYLRLALGHGGALVQLARKDQALRPVRKDFEKQFDEIAPAKEEPKPAEIAPEPVTHVVLDQPEGDLVSLLPGITDKQVEALQKLSIRTWSDLLLNGVDVDSRRALQKKTKVDMSRLLWWLNLCDLTRIPGLDLYSAVLLEDMGKVDTVKELQKRSAVKLYDALGQRIAKEKLAEWIASARELIPSLEYNVPGKPKSKSK